MRERHREDAAEDRVPRGEADDEAPELDLVELYARVFGFAEAEEREAHRAGHRRDERHVGHGLVRKQEPVRHRREREAAEQAGSSPEALGDPFVEEVGAEHARDRGGRAHGPLRVRHRAERAFEHAPGLHVHAERRDR